ncbi:MAG: oligosaccharide flippase family protein [Candidatus Bathyarchaeia archaeon]|jgi:O-antigen/teichoic acid export membrane protein
MSKAADMAKVSAKGSFHLLWGLVASTVISAVGTILVARLLAPSEFGLYSIALTAPNLIGLFSDWGVATAMIKFTAQYKSENKTAEMNSIFVAGLVFKTVLGLSLTIISFLLSGFLATTVFDRPQMTSLIQVASSIILTGAIISAAQAVFTGVERMELNSITYLIQSIFKSILVPALVILGLGAFGAVTGYAITSVLSGVTCVMIMWIVYRDLMKPVGYRLEIMKNIRTMFKYGLPLSISTILNSALLQFYYFVLAIFVSNSAMGNFSVAYSFLVLITFFATPISMVMFPAFSKLDAQKDRETLKSVYQFSVKYATLFVISAAFLVAALSQQAVFTLFGDKYIEAPLFLSFMSITYLYTAIGSISSPNLISSQGHNKFMLKLALLTTAIGLPLGLVLISQFGVLGYITVIFVDGLPSIIISLRWLKKNYGVTVDLASSAKIILSAGIAAVVTYVLVSLMPFGSLLKLIVGIIIFTFVLLSTILSTRAIDRTDLNNLRDMLAELGPFSGFFNFLLNILEKLMRVFQL